MSRDGSLKNFESLKRQKRKKLLDLSTSLLSSIFLTHDAHVHVFVLLAYQDTYLLFDLRSGPVFFFSCFVRRDVRHCVTRRCVSSTTSTSPMEKHPEHFTAPYGKKKKKKKQE